MGGTWKRIALAVAVFMAIVAPGTYRVVGQPPIYQADALILFALGPEYVYVPETDQASIKAPNPGDFQGVVNAEMLLLDNPDLHRAAVREVGLFRAFPDLPNDPAGIAEAAVRFGESTRIELITGSYVVKVAVHHTDPAIAAALANALTEAFFERRRRLYAAREVVSLQTRLDAVTTQLDNLAARIDRLLDGGSPLAVEAELERALSEEAHLALALRDAEADRAGLEQRLVASQDRVDRDAERRETEAELAEQRARIASLEAARAEAGGVVDRLSRLLPRVRPLVDKRAEQAGRATDLRVRLQEAEALGGPAGQDNVRVIEEAIPPLQPSSMPRRVQLAIVVIVGIAAAIIAAMIPHLLSRGRPTPPRSTTFDDGRSPLPLRPVDRAGSMALAGRGRGARS